MDGADPHAPGRHGVTPLAMYHRDEKGLIKTGA